MLGTAGDVPLPRGFLGGGGWGSPGLRSPSLSPAPLFRPPFPRESSVLLTVWELLSCGTCIPGPAAGQEPVFCRGGFQSGRAFLRSWRLEAEIRDSGLASGENLLPGLQMPPCHCGGPGVGERKAWGGRGGALQTEREGARGSGVALFFRRPQ